MNSGEMIRGLNAGDGGLNGGDGGDEDREKRRVMAEGGDEENRDEGDKMIFKESRKGKPNETKRYQKETPPKEYGNRSGMSYRDSLFSLNSTGFLSPNNKEDDIMQGWKGYLAQVNASREKEDVEEEEQDKSENSQMKKPTLTINADEYK